MLGLSPKKTQKTLKTLHGFGVYSVDENGVIYSRRMVKDEKIRQIRANAGKLGGSPLLKQKVKQTGKQKQTPSSSSSIPSSSSKEDTPKSPKRGPGRLSEKQKKSKRVESNSVLMIRIGGWYGRRNSTLWSLYDSEALEMIGDIDPEDLAIMERYYTAKIKKDDYRRRDIGTLLNNWTGELDRARSYCTENVPLKKEELWAPSGWIKSMEAKLGHSNFEKEWWNISHAMKKEIIELVENQ